MPHNAFAVHAHFYQPSREDPLTGSLPVEQGAWPYPNWNERIYAECYRPNAELGNFSRISFNLGPTLTDWLQAHHPETLRKITEQDLANVQRHGVGNALAQAYHHTILPLGSYQDKMTQVYWGMADFAHRFGRWPQGMWLPETAVDLETLEVLARLGIQYTVLAPWQAEEAAREELTEAFRVELANGRSVSAFFYQGDLSGKMSFEPGVTVNADAFAQTLLLPCFRPRKESQSPQLTLIASDGELFGHHQALREYFLQHLMNGASSGSGLQHTTLGRWLQEHPARKSIRIRERTSWSCHHGISRWTGGCPCSPGDGLWKSRLRQAFERLAGELDGLYLEGVQGLVGDAWRLRERYIHTRLGEMRGEALLGEMASVGLTSEQTRRLHLLLEMQFERQRMFTSCGWFFEDFERIEPRNNLAYAAQAVHLAGLATGVSLEEQTSQDLKWVIGPTSHMGANRLFKERIERANEALPTPL